MVPAFISTIAFAPFAFADDACGKFDFSSGVDCEIKVEGGCKTECTPLKFQSACQGACDADIDATCSVDCQAKCVADCDPGAIDCTAACNTDCQARCTGECSGEGCAAACDATCNAECSASCEVTPPSCEASCEASCDGSCKAEANIDCNIDCYAELEGGCNTQCEEPSGALFCNGQYVAASDLEACIKHIQNDLDGEVNLEARGEVTCSLGEGCEGTSSSNCSVSSAGSTAAGTGALAALGLALGAMIRRRRRDDE